MGALLEAIPAPVVALLSGALSALLGAAGVCAVIWAQRPVNRANAHNAEAQADKAQAETAAIQTALVNALVVQVATLQEQVREIPGLRAEVERLRRELDTRAATQAGIMERLRKCEERATVNKGGGV